MKVLGDWESRISATSLPANDTEWAITFSVLLIIILVIDKTLGAEYYYCEGKIQLSGYDAGERAKFHDLVRLTQTELFDRFKEIFHKKFKTRQGGEKACNPIRDGIYAFHGRSDSCCVARLVYDLQIIVEEFSKPYLYRQF
jgi:hypothetical protein